MRSFKFVKVLLVIAILSIGRYASFSQDLSQLQDALSASYKYEYKTDYAKAIEELKKVYVADNYYLNLRLGWLNYWAGKYNESVTYYQQAIKLMPNSVEAKLGLTYPTSAMGNTEKLKTIYNEVLALDDKNTTANYNLGFVFYNKKDYDSALKYFEKVVNSFPFDYNSMIMYGWTKYKLGKLQEAKTIFNKILLINPYDTSAIEGLGFIK